MLPRSEYYSLGVLNCLVVYLVPNCACVYTYVYGCMYTLLIHIHVRIGNGASVYSGCGVVTGSLSWRGVGWCCALLVHSEKSVCLPSQQRGGVGCSCPLAVLVSDKSRRVDSQAIPFFSAAATAPLSEPTPLFPVRDLPHCSSSTCECLQSLPAHGCMSAVPSLFVLSAPMTK